MPSCSTRILLSGLAASAVAACLLATSATGRTRVLRPAHRRYGETLQAALGFANRQAVTTLWMALVERWQRHAGRPLRFHPVIDAAILSALGTGVDHALRPASEADGTAPAKRTIIATCIIAALALVAGTRRVR
ncbi:hypothetical protein MWN34_09680 [Ancylobacter sp. 6x-1]|uniref:Uncharacterized protein n=1 Tax=Ancylobacter crimeensis TaxID=2579147 RepID=A0ABT0DB55_9HYPH|nr:hypothetical protein [Ancylobacter crimeensis]MCK0197182.1 hypothetical protein [Ancylobacter crimeensis]